jgi:membrane fusion protein (multidrug efflux system)
MNDGEDRGKQPDDDKGNPDKKTDDKDDKEPPKKHSRWPLIALGAAIVVAAIGALIYWLLTKDQQNTDDANTDGRAVMIAPKVGGYVTQLAVNDNQRVHEGDVLLLIDPRDYIVARDQAAGQLAAMQAQLDNAKVALEKARTTYPAQLRQAQGQLLEAQGRFIQAQREHDRQHHVDYQATTQQIIDQSDSGLKIAQGQMEEAEAQVHQAELVPEDIAQAEAQVKQLEGQRLQAEASLAQAELNLSYTRVVAPHDGWVTKRNVEQGALVQPGTLVMALVEPEVWVTANYKESELTRMRPGQRVEIRIDAYPDLRLEGHVDSVQLGTGSRFTAFPAENATGNFVKIVQRVPVKIVIDKGLDPNAPPLPLGMSVIPTVYFK